MLIDLQLHSTYSDGYLTPTEVVNFIAQQGVKIVSLTDHNTVGGLDEFRAACKKHKIKPIVGLELYVKLNNRRLNVLWFNFDEKNPQLHEMLRYSQIRRRNQTRKALQNLISLKLIKLNVEKTLDKYTHYTPINHIIDDIWAIPKNRQLIKARLKNKNPKEREIISEYFFNSDLGKLNNSYLNLERIIKLRKKIGGQIILNHPGKHDRLQRDLLTKLKQIGADGLEVLSPHHSIGAVMFAQHMAKELDFIETGGSDFHRHEGGNFPLQNSWQYFKIDSKYLRGIEKIIG
jgi:hypothetical protein